MITYDISIIVATARPSNLTRVIEYIERQSVSGISFEVVIVQESTGNHREFNINTKLPINSIIVEQQCFNNDYGATAHDTGIVNSRGNYVVFWDDDNIYYPHALIAQYSTANGFDIGVVRTIHQGLAIPSNNHIIAGDIDTMCICVKKELAIKERWASGGGRYSDYRWVSRLLKHDPTVNYSKVIIGHHL